MFSEINNSKESIKNRMLKHALNFWELRNIEDLDPLVLLILEALSTELYNLTKDIKDTKERLLEKISNLLAPEFLTCPRPAHAILHAAPIEPIEFIDDTTHFNAEGKIPSKQDESLTVNSDFFFTPIDKIKLFNANISFSATANNLFEYDPSLNKKLTAHTIRGSNFGNNTLWLGLAIDDAIENLDGLSFYFDWKNIESESTRLFYQLLPSSLWYIDSNQIETVSGILYQKTPLDADAMDHIFTDYDPLNIMTNDMKRFFDSKFITIRDEKLNNVKNYKQQYPASFKDIFLPADLAKLNQKLLWIKIIFPIALNQEIINEISVCLNAFPVMNRKLNDLKYKLKGGNTTIPLKASGLEEFLCVKSFADEIHEYRSIPLKKSGKENAGTFTLRAGGLERFDDRNAKEYISYLIELLRSENSAFSAYGYDFIASSIREMNQLISLVEEKTKGLIDDTTEIPHYIVVKPFEGQDIMYVEYWTTLAESGNRLRSGTRLQQVSGAKIKTDSIFLLTTTTGGKDKLKTEEKLNSFRYGLMTRNRIVTKEDIYNFCFSEVGDNAGSISVEKGFELSPLEKNGFTRTTDITITPSQKLNDQNWENLCNQLKSKLEARSGMSVHYRVLMKTI